MDGNTERMIGLLGRMATDATMLHVVRTVRPAELQEHKAWDRLDRTNDSLQRLLHSHPPLRSLFGRLLDETELM